MMKEKSKEVFISKRWGGNFPFFLYSQRNFSLNILMNMVFTQASSSWVTEIRCYWIASETYLHPI